jgi:hypothetical protein
MVAKYRFVNNYMMIRKSKWGWFPHFAAVFEHDDGSIVKMEYVPLTPSRKRWWQLPLFFKGKVVTTTYRLDSVEESSWK